MKRYHSLDYLRGMAAFAIMYYHYFSWSFGVYDASTFLGRIGLYGVSLFYILSGLTLFLVYYNNENKPFLMKDFFIKRIFRIMPLFWLAILITIILKGKATINYSVLLLNITGLFGIVNSGLSIPRAGWSIGNEIVFYLFFPIFIILSKRSIHLFYLLASALLFIFLWFAFFYLNANSTILDEWGKYINPLNQIMLFLGGYLIGYLFCDKKIDQKLNVFILLAAVTAFMLYPANGERIVLVTGFNRIIFSLICIVICFSAFKVTLKIPLFIHKPLSVLGEMSYSVYLLHPIFWTLIELLISKYKVDIPAYLKVTVCMLMTLTCSYFIYNKFEKYFMKKGRTLFAKANVVKPLEIVKDN